MEVMTYIDVTKMRYTIQKMTSLSYMQMNTVSAHCLFVCDGVQHVLCCVFIRLVYPILSVSLDFPFVIALSVFSDVYEI
jgi:hypothetical protein